MSYEGNFDVVIEGVGAQRGARVMTAQEGLYIYYDPKAAGQGQGPRRHLMDIAPTILEIMGVPIPLDMQGQSFAV